jgi:hypothetical protein
MPTNAGSRAQSELEKQESTMNLQNVLQITYRHVITVHHGDPLAIFHKPPVRVKDIGILSKDASVAVCNPAVDADNSLYS